MRCTWRGCELEGIFVQRLQNGETYAVLCDAHRLEFYEVISGTDRQAIQRAFRLAQGSVGTSFPPPDKR